MRWIAGAITAVVLLGLTTGCSKDSTTSVACQLAPTDLPAAATTGSTAGSNTAANPEIATGYRAGMQAVHTGSYAVATANPVATHAACEVLRKGGTAADALVAAQTVLGLVEPQSSGVGGGAVLMYFDAARHTVEAYDGRETAPAAATKDYLRWIDPTDHAQPRPSTRASGRSIGVPGALRLLEVAHRDHGKTPWDTLFNPAIELAAHGLRISPRLAESIAGSAADLATDPAARAYFLNPDGSPKQAGVKLTNPAMATTLRALAAHGADALYHGPIAQDIVNAVATTTSGRTPGAMTGDDLAQYQARKRAPIVSTYRGHTLYGMPNPTSGGIAVAATLGMLENLDLAPLGPAHPDANGGRPTAEAVQMIAQAERLAYADRDKYVADSDFVPLPGNSPDSLLNKDYLKSRAALIDPAHPMNQALPGDLGPVPVGVGPQPPEHGTSHISVVDSYGNAAAMTTTIESAFGSFHMVDGFLLNNQLTDFSADPVGTDGAPMANRIQPGKRPRSSMAPTLVFATKSDGTRGDLQYVTGSPGGSTIIQFVVKTLVAMLDWRLDPQQAVGEVDFGAVNTAVTNVGGEDPEIDATDNGNHDPLVHQLRTLGDTVSVAPQSSGLSALRRDGSGWVGGADPRREGVVLGDPPRR